MSTAIMHQSTLYDFGDLLLKVWNDSLSQEDGQFPDLNQIRPGAQTMANGSWGEHTALVRTNSLPAQPGLMGLLDRLGQHRRLERTTSEPTSPPQPQQATSRYKTELCRPFEEAGVCKYGDKCQFAHGYRELRNLQRHPKYKTELCRTFHSVGFCPYGPRCHFVHNSEEARRREPVSPGGSVASLSSSGGSYGSYNTGSARSPPALSPSVFAYPRRAHSPLTETPSPPGSPQHEELDESRLPVFNRLSSVFSDLVIA